MHYRLNSDSLCTSNVNSAQIKNNNKVLSNPVHEQDVYWRSKRSVARIKQANRQATGTVSLITTCWKEHIIWNQFFSTEYSRGDAGVAVWVLWSEAAAGHDAASLRVEFSICAVGAIIICSGEKKWSCSKTALNQPCVLQLKVYSGTYRQTPVWPSLSALALRPVGFYGVWTEPSESPQRPSEYCKLRRIRRKLEIRKSRKKFNDILISSMKNV